MKDSCHCFAHFSIYEYTYTWCLVRISEIILRNVRLMFKWSNMWILSFVSNDYHTQFAEISPLKILKQWLRDLLFVLNLKYFERVCKTKQPRKRSNYMYSSLLVNEFVCRLKFKQNTKEAVSETMCHSRSGCL